jgi:hypothetical protein
MKTKRALVIAATLTALMSLTTPSASVGSPVTQSECERGGGRVFTNVNERRECDGGTFEGRLVA